jgi:ribonuclease P/MRP protein subunit POP5
MASESSGGQPTTNRNSHRYLLVRFITKDAVTTKVIEQTVRRSVEDMVGKLGSAEMNVRFIGFQEADGRAVFRCKSGSVERLRAALALVTHVDGNPAAAMVLRSSGTIKALKVRIPRRRRSAA